MVMHPVASSNLSDVGYDNASKTLYIRFRRGGTYAYDNVPESVYTGLMGAASKGEYHAAYIKHSYRYRRIG